MFFSVGNKAYPCAKGQGRARYLADGGIPLGWRAHSGELTPCSVGALSKRDIPDKYPPFYKVYMELMVQLKNLIFEV